MNSFELQDLLIALKFLSRNSVDGLLGVENLIHALGVTPFVLSVLHCRIGYTGFSFKFNAEGPSRNSISRIKKTGSVLSRQFFSDLENLKP